MLMKNPDLFHGYFHPDGFFEGWYFRIDWDGRSLCFIPGVSVGEDSFAFVQVVDSQTRQSHMLRYPLTDFSCAENTPMIRVGGNLFSLALIRLGLAGSGLALSGRLKLSEVHTYPNWWLGRGSMGMLGQIDCLECYTQICALSGRVDGDISLNGRAVNISGGKLYVEKNWGRSFPSSYCWIQGRFGSDVGLSCSIGRVPLGPLAFDGIIACLYHGNKLYHFHTLRRSRFDLGITGDNVFLSAVGGRYALKVQVRGGQPMELPAPIRGGMGGTAFESLDARAGLQLYDLCTGACLLRREASGVGLEIGGDWRTDNESSDVAL